MVGLPRHPFRGREWRPPRTGEETLARGVTAGGGRGRPLLEMWSMNKEAQWALIAPGGNPAISRGINVATIRRGLLFSFCCPGGEEDKQNRQSMGRSAPPGNDSQPDGSDLDRLSRDSPRPTRGTRGSIPTEEVSHVTICCPLSARLVLLSPLNYQQSRPDDTRTRALGNEQGEQ